MTSSLSLYHDVRTWAEANRYQLRTGGVARVHHRPHQCLAPGLAQLGSHEKLNAMIAAAMERVGGSNLAPQRGISPALGGDLGVRLSSTAAMASEYEANTAWRPLAIVRVERIEIGDRGWRVVFRE